MTERCGWVGVCACIFVPACTLLQMNAIRRVKTDTPLVDSVTEIESTSQTPHRHQRNSQRSDKVRLAGPA